jgi:hypothetical protein
MRTLDAAKCQHATKKDFETTSSGLNSCKMFLLPDVTCIFAFNGNEFPSSSYQRLATQLRSKLERLGAGVAVD